MAKTISPSISATLKHSLPASAFQLTDAQIEKLRTVSHITLAVLAAAGILTLAAVAPNTIQLLAKTPLGRRTYRSRFSKDRDQSQKIIKSFYYLKKQKYIKLTETGGQVYVRITEKGLKRIKNLDFSVLNIPRLNKWNGRWWLVLADIPSRNFRVSADYFRRKLKDLGFYPLQRTAWIYPFDPTKQVEQVGIHYHLSPFITVAEVAKLESADHKKLLKHFKIQGVL